MARAKKTKGASAERPGQADPTAPLDGRELLAAARPVLELLREDLGKRAEDPRVERALRTRYEDEKAARRTADSFGEWRDGLLAQVAASWFLSCVFVRTLEDRGLLGSARIAGPGATDSQTLFFQLAPSLTERDYLLFVFRELAELPAAHALFDREHAMVWQLSPSADAAKELLRLFRTPSAEEPAFRFGQPSTRFLGDLYQDLYEDVRKRYALLQTPDFIESFILDRTLEPAIERFGLDDTTLIDPTCGSGHFLLGAFDRLFDHRLRVKPGIDVRQAAHQALDAVYGADINPYAVAIARVRLTLSYLEKAGIGLLKDAPALPLHLVVADSLLYNPQHAQLGFEHQEGQSTEGWRAEAFQLEDPVAARDVLHRRYAAVVGNPPYIAEKDSAKRETYRAMYPRSAAGKYALSAPFCERFFQLARERGSVGQITANSFMKREFGKMLIQEYLKGVNLEVIVNTSGAYIPGHGTPTVLLFGTHEPPINRMVLTVLAKRGEPSTPDDPAKGEVWASIAAHWRNLGFDNDYITVANMDRDKLASHPWSLGGGGAVELKEILEDRTVQRLEDMTSAIGVMALAGTDEVYIMDRPKMFLRMGIDNSAFRPLGIGENIRDWSMASLAILYPHNEDGSFKPLPSAERYLWRYRSILRNYIFFGKTKEARGLDWRELGAVLKDKLDAPLSIAFSEVATHNHFVLDRGDKVFNRTAPIIKLPPTATEDDHLALLAYLNSSSACFWMKQVAYPKGMHNGSESNATPFLVRFAFDGTKLAHLPIPDALNGRLRSDFVALGRELDALATKRRRISAVTEIETATTNQDVADRVRRCFSERQALLEKQVALQECVDWLTYKALGLVHDVPEIPDSISLGLRPFEQRLLISKDDRAREWFRWIGIDPVNFPLTQWARPFISLIEADPMLGLLESPECKRRWVQPAGKAAQSLETDDKMLADELRDWMTDRIEDGCATSTEIVSARGVANGLARDSALLAVCRWLSGDEALSINDMVSTLLDDLSVPFVAASRHSASGLLRHKEWQQVWDHQRREDQGVAVERGPIPPKYEQADFASASYFSLRGKLDVPKERFISYPGCESDEDGEPVYGWAGWNHLQQAQALASLYQMRKTEEGWTRERLMPMLAGLLELLPWVKQWHNAPDPEFDGQRMGDFFAQFLDGECQALGLTHADLEAWRPNRATKKPTKTASIPATSEDADSLPPKRTRKKGKE